MFINVPSLQRKKKSQFSHLLVGAKFDNRKYQSKCSFADSDLKLSTVDSQKEIERITNRSRINQSHRRASSMREVKSKINESCCFEGNTNLTLQRRNPTFIQTKGMKGNEQLQIQKKSFKNTKYSSQTSCRPWSSKLVENERLFHQNKQESSIFPTIEVRMIDRIKTLKEINNYSIQLNLQSMFKKLISSQLMGEYTRLFIQKIEEYKQKIIQSGQYSKKEGIVLNHQYLCLSRKEDFLKLISELEVKDQCEEVILELVKHYCFPADKFCNKIKKDFLNNIIILIQQKVDLINNYEYLLLTQSGKPINHICEVSLFANVLLLVPKIIQSSALENYLRLFEQEKYSNRLNFKDAVKYNFMQKFNSQIENESANKDFVQLSRNKNCREVQAKTETLFEKSKRQYYKRNQFYSIYTDIPSKIFFNKGVISKVDGDMMSLRNEKVMSEFRRMLDPNSKYVIKTNMDQRTIQEFHRMKKFNQSYDIVFNFKEQNQNKLILDNLLQNHQLFRNKSIEQVALFKELFTRLYSLRNQPLKQVSFEQFKEITQTAYGVAEPNVIQKLILNYLNFDCYGELSKLNFYKLMKTSIGLKARSAHVIIGIIWHWLSTLKLVFNDSLRKSRFSQWFEPVRIVYFLFISIIFGDFDLNENLIHSVTSQ